MGAPAKPVASGGSALAPRELEGWLRLQQTPGVGPVLARKLLSAFGLPDQIFAASWPALLAVVPTPVAQALRVPLSATTRQLIDLTLAWLTQPGHALLTLADAAYPAALLSIADPPLLLYVQGRTELLARPALAVVGSRHASAQGMQNAERFADALSAAGLTIVSGLAQGIDAGAHSGALRQADGASTIAVIGTGCDSVYPACNRALAQRIAQHGCIVSEYALGTRAIAANFPRRNRLIAGLSRGVLVVEAAARSGSLITAHMAAEQGRDVFAIPGSIHAPLAKGCHHLIKEGAKLVESVADVLQELNFVPSVGACRRPPPAEDAAAKHAREPGFLALMGFDEVDFETLAARTQLPAATLMATLLTLELEGVVERLAGGHYRRLNG